MMSAPLARTSSGRIALTVAAVPTGMNAGVRISPRSIAMEPVLAAPSLPEIEKVKRVTRGAMPSSPTGVEEGPCTSHDGLFNCPCRISLVCWGEPMRHRRVALFLAVFVVARPAMAGTACPPHQPGAGYPWEVEGHFSGDQEADVSL